MVSRKEGTASIRRTHCQHIPWLLVNFAVVLVDLVDAVFKCIAVDKKSGVVSLVFPFGEECLDQRDDLPDGWATSRRKCLLNEV